MNGAGIQPEGPWATDREGWVGGVEGVGLQHGPEGGGGHHHGARHVGRGHRMGWEGACRGGGKRCVMEGSEGRLG